ncbi:hypothetical protein GGTG_13421 [Gaeumannomyces tritici R3-111a-1]|uniref:Uncharacterized protein n=1 Tax=Gaeumannomyces tritici (strain R3-111a-1) TaxID=644352 RepID=J3PIU1_GAET3|nr:hypothetical protein GGTG_13421 [Gaeumannomyces tritici R3-111a-1]EJT69024.1 hypothetical protein GGTG_13421 [Gaeumannomyces tritici R3-111a-1]
MKFSQPNQTSKPNKASSCLALVPPYLTFANHHPPLLSRHSSLYSLPFTIHMAASNNNYTIGWISADPIELTAARFFLDPHDTDSYVLGKIGPHNVVVACLSRGEGRTAAASVVATNMLRRFPNIRFGLMVGTGGGAPSSKNNMHLGDIVIGSPDNGHGGVLHYDFKELIQNRTPPALREAVADLRSEHETNGHCYEAQIRQMLGGQNKKYSRPKATSDELYKPEYTHSGDGMNCHACCDPENLVSRPERERREGGKDFAVVHYGLVASANQPMEDATIRDGLVGEAGVLCFDTGAAGLTNDFPFPCLVIRGICDYSDSHKNKDWQGFAAMMAAAYAKDLLNRIAPSQPPAGKTVGGVFGAAIALARGVVGLAGEGLSSLSKAFVIASAKTYAGVARLAGKITSGFRSLSKAVVIASAGGAAWLAGKLASGFSSLSKAFVRFRGWWAE